MHRANNHNGGTVQLNANTDAAIFKGLSSVMNQTWLPWLKWSKKHTEFYQNGGKAVNQSQRRRDH